MYCAGMPRLEPNYNICMALYIYTPSIKEHLNLLSAPTVVVAGLGRCGTTLLTSVSSHGMHVRYYPHTPLQYAIAAVYSCLGKGDTEDWNRRRLTHKSTETRLASFGYIIRVAKRGYVYKIHGYPFPDRPLPSHVRVIWMFGNPMMIAASVRNIYPSNSVGRENWHILHYRHTESPHYKHRDEILARDTCMLERHFDAWYRPHAFPFLSVRYEALEKAEVRQAITDFVGLPLQFPRWKRRRTKWQSHPQRAQLEAAYGRLQAKVEAAEDVKRWQSSAVRLEWQER